MNNKKFKVVITDREYEDINHELEIIGRAGGEVFAYRYRDKESILKVVREADAIIVQYAKISADLIENPEIMENGIDYFMNQDNYPDLQQ